MVQSRHNISQQAHHEIFSLFICLGVGLWEEGRLELLFNYATQFDEQLVVEQAEALERWCVLFEEDD
jgi:hypothetical protein